MTKGKFLASFKKFPRNPVILGFCKDENTIIFLSEDNRVSQLRLYNMDELEIINFVMDEANWYQLACLWHEYKDIKVSKYIGQRKWYPGLVVRLMGELIQSYRS